MPAVPSGISTKGPNSKLCKADGLGSLVWNKLQYCLDISGEQYLFHVIRIDQAPQTKNGS